MNILIFLILSKKKCKNLGCKKTVKYNEKRPNSFKWPRITLNNLNWPQTGLRMASNGFRPSQKVSNSPTWPQMAIRLINGLQWPLLSSNEGLGSLVKYISIIIWLKNDFSKKNWHTARKNIQSHFFSYSL